MAIAGTNWRLANSLIKLREQINATYPNRNKASDGTIGDQAHQAQGSTSEHNPNAQGVVCAFDITHDPASGLDVQKLADSIAESRDGRIKYMIFNDRIMVPNDYGWVWVFHYEGSHRKHLHVSVWGDYDNTNEWNIGRGDEMVTRETLQKLWAGYFDRSPMDNEYQQFVGRPVELIIDTAWKSQEFKGRMDGLRGLFHGNVALKDEYKRLQDELKRAQDQATLATAELAKRDAAPTTQPATTGEPIDTKNVNWLVRILIQMFDKKK